MKNKTSKMYGTRAQGSAAKPSKKKPRTMQIHENLERIREGKLCDMGLFELSIRALMSTEVYHEIRNRLMLLQASLKVGDMAAAKKLVAGLLDGPQRRGA